MNFRQLRSDTDQRYNEVVILLNYIAANESDNPLEPDLNEVKITRGLAYVHLYAAFERSINDLVTQIIISIGSFNVVHFHYVPQFNTIAANKHLKSFKDSSYKKFVSKSTELIEKLNCREVPSLDETVLARYLQNIWYETLVDIREVFGIKPMIEDPRIRTTVDEIVGNRNAIAHGRQSPIAIGQSQKSTVIREKLNLLQQVNHDTIDDFEDYFSGKKFIKPSSRRFY